jgi:ectoine hydroxylase-related dioxygenase (phytanoyl-CoA dioxygenase family)
MSNTDKQAVEELATGVSLADAQQQLEEDGYLLVEGLCDPKFVAHLLAVSLSRSDQVMSALGPQSIGIGSAAGFDEVVQRSPGRWDIPISPDEFEVDKRALPWWPLITAVLGEDAEHSFSGVVYSDPGSPAQCWHIDSPHVSADHLPPHALNVMIALHDTPLAMGPTEIAKGSHRLTNHLQNPALVSDELVYQHQTTVPEKLVADTEDAIPEGFSSALSAGSCLIFDDRILHRGLGNASDSRRSMVYFSYRQKGYSENTHFEAQRSIHDAGR